MSDKPEKREPEAEEAEETEWERLCKEQRLDPRTGIPNDSHFHLRRQWAQRFRPFL